MVCKIGMAGTNIHYQSIDVAQKFIQLFEKVAACLILNGKGGCDEARINNLVRS